MAKIGAFKTLFVFILNKQLVFYYLTYLNEYFKFAKSKTTKPCGFLIFYSNQALGGSL